MPERNRSHGVIARGQRLFVKLQRAILRHLPVETQAKKIAELVEGVYIEEFTAKGLRKVYQRPPSEAALKMAVEYTAGRAPQPVEVSGQIDHVHTMRQIIVPSKVMTRERQLPASIPVNASIEVLESKPARAASGRFGSDKVPARKDQGQEPPALELLTFD